MRRTGLESLDGRLGSAIGRVGCSQSLPFHVVQAFRKLFLVSNSLNTHERVLRKAGLCTRGETQKLIISSIRTSCEIKK